MYCVINYFQYDRNEDTGIFALSKLELVDKYLNINLSFNHLIKTLPKKPD